jgi:hypothetical protein
MVLQFFMVIFFAIPITITVFTVITSTFQPGILLTYGVFGFSGFFFLKLFLWNKYGIEHLYLSADSIVYEADYKMFRGNRREVSTADLEIIILNPGNANVRHPVLVATDGNARIETVSNVPIDELVELKKRIEAFYGAVNG